jgi:hypothetical protein
MRSAGKRKTRADPSKSQESLTTKSKKKTVSSKKRVIAQKNPDEEPSSHSHHRGCEVVVEITSPKKKVRLVDWSQTIIKADDAGMISAKQQTEAMPLNSIAFSLNDSAPLTLTTATQHMASEGTTPANQNIPLTESLDPLNLPNGETTHLIKLHFVTSLT